MNLLDDSPLHSLPFDFFNNLWAWIALIIWRIRTPKPELLHPSFDTLSDQPDPIPEVSESCHDDNGGPACVHSVVVGNGVSEDVIDGVTKGKVKFTSYFYEEDVDDDVSDDETLKITEREGIRLGWWERWEKLLMTRTGENENGWYTCQDLTVFNGNVVTFWDDGGFGFATLANGGGRGSEQLQTMTVNSIDHES